MNSNSTVAPIYSIYHDEPDFRELLEEFVQAVEPRSELLRTLFASGEIEPLKVQAHQLKGAGGGFGFEGLSELAGELEVACKRPDPQVDEIGTLLDRVVDYLSRVSV
jgi:histidine phosphotransfer protein HptB